MILVPSVPEARVQTITLAIPIFEIRVSNVVDIIFKYEMHVMKNIERITDVMSVFCIHKRKRMTLNPLYVVGGYRYKIEIILW